MNALVQAVKTFWFDIPSAEPVDSMSFYEALFHWRFLRMVDSPVPDYWVIQAGDELIGGLRRCSATAPVSGAPILYFTVEDLEKTAARLRELGGTIEGPAVDLGRGRGRYQWFRDRQKNLLAFWSKGATL